MRTVLLATDADWIADEVDAALTDDDVEVLRIRTGAEVVDVTADLEPDLVVLDLQIGNMGGMAACMALHLEEGADRLAHVPVLMLLDRRPDVFLARRSGAEGWLVKPFDALRLRRAVRALMGGGTYEDPSYAPPTVETVEAG